MYLIGNDYDSICTFLVGYSLGYREAANVDVAKAFQEWLQVKEKKHFSLHWSAYILNHMADNDKKKAQRILFKLLNRFIENAK